MGRRLGKFTADNTKCRVKIHGLTLVERMLDTLARTEVRRVVLVVGYKSENVKKLVGRKYKGMKGHPNLIVIKSISKGYGVPGLRLGIMATSEEDLLASTREKISIWNINSFGEFFLRIFGKYRSDYRLVCTRIAEERDRFYLQLKEIKFLRVIPSQSNYFLCELMHKYSTTELVTQLLEKYEIMIKNCTGKVGFEGKNYVRIATQNTADSDFLLEKLQAL